MSSTWLFLDLNSFFASVEQADNPALRHKPVGVVPMIVDSTCCLAASYEAKAFGVKTGTSLRDAKKMCPGIIFIVADHRKYIRYHKQILEAVESCYPISAVLSIDEMAFELTGRDSIEENAIKKAYQMKEAIYKKVSPALSCSIGLAPNRYLGKVGSDMQKPDGLVIIRPDEIPTVFYSLKIKDFPGIGHRMEKRFFDYGCYTVEELYKLSASQLKTIWGGIIGEEFWQLIRGENLLDKATQTRTIGHSRVIAPEHRRDRSYIKAICMQLLTKACIRLRDGNLYARVLQFNAKYLDNTEKSYWGKKIKFEETQNTLFLTSELDKILRKLPTGNILQIGITLMGLVQEKAHQMSLFEDKRDKPLMEAIDKLNKKHHKNLIYPASSNLCSDKTPAKIAFSRIPEEDE